MDGVVVVVVFQRGLRIGKPGVGLFHCIVCPFRPAWVLGRACPFGDQRCGLWTLDLGPSTSDLGPRRSVGAGVLKSTSVNTGLRRNRVTLAEQQ